MKNANLRIEKKCLANISFVSIIYLHAASKIVNCTDNNLIVGRRTETLLYDGDEKKDRSACKANFWIVNHTSPLDTYLKHSLLLITKDRSKL